MPGAAYLGGTGGPRSGKHEAAMDDLMKDVLKDLEAQWRKVSAYSDLKALPWAPGDAMPSTCPRGCALVDSGWRSMMHEEGGLDAFRRTLFCRRHSFARIYVITGPSAAENGWRPPES